MNDNLKLLAKSRIRCADLHRNWHPALRAHFSTRVGATRMVRHDRSGSAVQEPGWRVRTGGFSRLGVVCAWACSLRTEITAAGSSKGVVKRGRRARPRLDDPAFDGPLDDPFGDEHRHDEGPDPHKGPPRAVGTSTFAFPARSCADSAKCATLVEFDVRNTKIQVSAALGGPRGGLVPDRAYFSHQVGHQEYLQTG